jgi:hypothetical protein
VLIGAPVLVLQMLAFLMFREWMKLALSGVLRPLKPRNWVALDGSVVLEDLEDLVICLSFAVLLFPPHPVCSNHSAYPREYPRVRFLSLPLCQSFSAELDTVSLHVCAHFRCVTTKYY